MAAVVAVAGGLLSAPSPTLSALLTTFAAYAAMDEDGRAEVRNNATVVIYRDAAKRGDESQKACLQRTYIDGPEHDVRFAHAKLRGLLEGGIEVHDDRSRVEYAVARHLDAVCPVTVPRAQG